MLSLRRRALFGFAAALVSLAAFPVFPAFSQDGGQPVRGGTLVAIIQPEPTALTTVVNNQYPNAVVSANIFDGLVTYGDDMTPQPSLAERWEIAPDGLSITFHLRHGVKWQDGQDFTSADVQFSALQLWKKAFAYQIFVVAQPRPSLERLLLDAEETAATRTRARNAPG